MPTPRAPCIPIRVSNPANSGPELVRCINNALTRADQIARQEGVNDTIEWFAPILVDAEAGFGGPLNAFELTKAYIEAGAAGVHFEDQLASEKKCGHMGAKVLIPTVQHIRNLNAARLAADVAGVPTLIVCRTDAESARLITADVDVRDRPFLSGERTAEGFHRLRDGAEEAMARCIARGLAFAPYADLLWMETSTPDLGQARHFAEAIRREFPGQRLAYNCSPSFNWRANLPADEIARGYAGRDMAAYSELQEAEFATQAADYTAVRHQREGGTGYFDAVAEAIAGPEASTTALAHSTEAAQFAAPTDASAAE